MCTAHLHSVFYQYVKFQVESFNTFRSYDADKNSKRKVGYFRNQRQIILECKQRSKFQETGAQLDIIEIKSGKFQIIPMETVGGVEHTRNC